VISILLANAKNPFVLCPRATLPKSKRATY
jgi:hypothetical protein